MEIIFREVDGNVLVVAPDGGLDRITGPELVAGLEKMIAAGMHNIIVDCTKLAFVSSLGVATLLQLHKRMRDLGGDVKLASVRSLVIDILKLARLDQMFEIYDDVDRARLAYRSDDAG